MTKPSSLRGADVKAKLASLEKKFKKQCHLGKSVPKHLTDVRSQDKKEKTPEKAPSLLGADPKVEVHLLLYVPPKRPTAVATTSKAIDHFDAIHAELNRTQAKCNCAQKLQEPFHETNQLKLYMFATCGNECPCQDIADFMDNTHPPIVASVSH